MAKRMLVAVDLSETSASTLAYAYEVARGLDAVIDGIFVVEGPVASRSLGHPSAKEIVDSLTRREAEVAQRELERLLSGVPDDRRGDPIVRHGNAVDVICREAAPSRYEMLVVSTRGRTGLSHMLIGSVAERVVRYAQVPVLVVR